MLKAISEKAYWLDILWAYTDPLWPWHARPHQCKVWVAGVCYMVSGSDGALRLSVAEGK